MIWINLNILLSIMSICQGVVSNQKAFKSANQTNFKPKESKKYVLPESERPFMNRIPEHFNWLSIVFQSLMTVEDVDRAYRTLRLIKAWGKHLYSQNTRYSEVAEKLHTDFDHFLMNLRSYKRQRKDKCSDINHEMQKLAGRDFKPVSSPCFEFVENSSETQTMNDILTHILGENLQGAYEILSRSENRERLYPMEMVYLILVMRQRHLQACVVLWDDDWGLTPFQKYQILRAYFDAVQSNIDPKLPEETVMANPILKNVKTLERGRDAMTRIVLSIGNLAIAERLKNHDSSLAGVVARCEAQRPGTPLHPTHPEPQANQQAPSQIPQSPPAHPEVKPRSEVPVQPKAPVHHEQVLPNQQPIIIQSFAHTPTIVDPAKAVPAAQVTVHHGAREAASAMPVFQPTAVTDLVPVLVPRAAITGNEQKVATAPIVHAIPVTSQLAPSQAPVSPPQLPVPVAPSVPVHDNLVDPPMIELPPIPEPMQAAPEPEKPMAEITYSKPAEILCSCPRDDRRPLLDSIKGIKEALEHFRESLRKSPEEEAASKEAITRLEVALVKIRPLA